MEQGRSGEKPSLVFTRHYAVAPQRVYRAWTTPQAVKAWWGPGGRDPVSVAELDVRRGGRFRIVFGGPKGDQHEVRGEYREVIPDRKLVFTWTWPRSTPERESLVTILFNPAGEGTELSFRHEQFIDETVRDNHRRGWGDSFAKLDEYLNNQGES